MTMIPTEGRLAGPREPTDYEKRIYGDGVRLHEITALPLEVGYGALPPAQQAVGHLKTMRHWASKQIMLIADFDTAIVGAADEMKADLQKRRVAAAADLALLNKRIAAVAAALGVSH